MTAGSNESESLEYFSKGRKIVIFDKNCGFESSFGPKMTFVFDCGFDMIDLKFSELSQTYESSIWDVGFDLLSHPKYRPDFPKDRPAFEYKNPNWVIIT